VTRNGPSRNHEPARILQQFTDKYEYSCIYLSLRRRNNSGHKP
jgi:hypothetical protein